MIRVEAEPFDPGALLNAFVAANPTAGGVASFMGQVRGDRDGDKIVRLTLEHYAGMTEREIAKIDARARERWPVLDTLIVHRYGELRPAEPIVFVAAAAAHRRAAFEAADFLMDYLKTDAPFWKREETEAGAAWIEPRTQDRRDRARWTRAHQETAP